MSSSNAEPFGVCARAVYGTLRLLPGVTEPGEPPVTKAANTSSPASTAAGARVQAPFTLSDTSTCPGTLYCENHPTSRSPPATGLVSVTVVVRTRDPLENAVPWTKVGVVA